MIDTTTQIHQIEDIFNVGIPFLYKRYDTEFACIPGITYVRTLASNGVKTVGELYDGSRKQVKKLLDLKSGLEMHIDLIYDIFNSFESDPETGNKIVTLPIAYDDSKHFVENARAFVRDLYETISSGSEVPAYRNAFTTTVREIYVYNRYHPDCTSIETLSKDLKCTGSNIDFKVQTFKGYIRSLLEGKRVEIFDVVFKADPRMISHFENLAKRVGNTISVDTFKRKTGADDQRTLTFLSDALGMTLSTGVSGKKIPCVSKCPVKLIDKNIGTLVDYFRKNVIHIRYEADFKPFLKSTFSSEPQLVSAFDSLVNHSDEFIWNEEEGEKVVALRWDLLEYMPPRICWLLYENGAVDFRTSLSGSDLVKLYNIKARRIGDPTVTEDQLHPTHFVRDCWRIMPVGKKGYWRLRNSAYESFDIDAYASGYITKVSSTDLDGFLHRAEEDGIARIYDISGLRTAFSRNGGKSSSKGKIVKKVKHWSEEQIRDILDFAEEVLSENDKSMPVPSLVRELQKLYPELNVGTCQMYLKTRPGSFDFLKRSGNQANIITLKGHRHLVPETYRDRIRKCAIADIICSEDNAIERSALYEKYCGYVPAGLHSTAALSKIFGDTKTFVKKEDKMGIVWISLTPLTLSREKAAMSETISREEEMRKYLKLLQDAPSYEWSSLKAALSAQFVSFFSSRGLKLSSALDNMYCIMSKGEGKVSEDSTFHEMLSALPDYFKGVLASDREYSLKKDLLINVEPFMKSFYKKRFSSDIVDDIERDWGKARKNIGLATILSYLENECNLLPYKEWYALGSLESRIRNMVKEVLNARNRTIGHAETEQDKTAASIKECVINVLSVMIYISSKL